LKALDPVQDVSLEVQSSTKSIPFFGYGTQPPLEDGMQMLAFEAPSSASLVDLYPPVAVPGLVTSMP